MLISCCICTYKRPKLLKDLILSLYAQKLKKNWILEIIIVDNDELFLGKQIVNQFSNTQQIEIKYYVQPIKNISLTRNMTVSKSRGDLILFIDDDGFASESWIYNMIDCMDKYQADAVFGTVIPVYENGVSDWIKKGGYFERLIQQTGEISRYTRTTNCLIKSNIIKEVPGPFNPTYGLTGGEDIDLFNTIKSKGGKFVFCKEGVVYDFIPKQRAQLKWLVFRRFRTGRGFTENQLKHSNLKLINGFFSIIKAGLYLCISLLLSIFLFPFKTKRIGWFLKAVSNFGHLAAFTKYDYKEYR
jgi:succinoglycan biosynthesis protein ExoM